MKEHQLAPMEGLHVVEGETTTFKECVSLVLKNRFILRLSFSAGIGGLLFGYDTGVISGALLYIKDDFRSVDRSTVLQESIVSMAIAGAIIGAAIGGWWSDRYGRRNAILLSDFLFLSGAIMMAAAPNPSLLMAGRLFVGLGVGMVSVTGPLYVSEASPAKVRGALVSSTGLFATGGQFISYLTNLAFTKVPGTWRWMLGLAGVPALLQFMLILLLPESPRWLYRKGREEEAEAILRKIYSPEKVDNEIQTLKESVEKEELENKSSDNITLTKLIKTKTVRRGLIAGVGLQVFQQFVGINTVMYYSPTIVQLAGFASNQTALLLSLVIAGLNTIGSIVSIYFIDKTGRKKLLVISLCGIVISLGLLSVVFHETALHAPAVSAAVEKSQFDKYICPAYRSDGFSLNSWDCMKCMKASSPSCGFCSSPKDKLLPGACLISNGTVKGICQGEDREWYTRGCPSSFGWLALIALALYILFFSPGMGPVPWIVNSEIYPLRFRGVCGGIAAAANWISNLIVAQSFLSLTEAVGASLTFLMYGVISVVALFFALVCVPETKGLQFEEVEKMLEERQFKLKFWEKGSAVLNKGQAV